MHGLAVRHTVFLHAAQAGDAVPGSASGSAPGRSPVVACIVKFFVLGVHLPLPQTGNLPPAKGSALLNHMT